MYARTIFASVLALVSPLCLLADEPVPEDQLPKELIGTWKMTSAVYAGNESVLPQQLHVLKHVTPTHATWMRSDPETGEVVSMACGRWKLKGDQYSETPEIGMGDDFATVKGATHEFTCKIIGNRWYHMGQLANGLTIEEVWERTLPPKAEADE